MFKKTLLALALASTTSAFAASTIGTSNTSDAAFAISNQGLPATKAFELADSTAFVSVNLKAADGSAIVKGSKLELTVSGAFFADATTTTAVEDVSAGTAIDLTVADSTTGNTSTKRVFDISAAGTQTAFEDTDRIKISDINLILANASSDVTFSAVFTSSTGVAVPSTAAPAKVVAQLKDEWTATVTTDGAATSGKLNAEIDVATDNKIFTGAATSDILTLYVAKTLTTASADAKEVTVTIKGDFTGIKTVASTGGAYAINTAKTEASRTISVEADVDTFLTNKAEAITFSLETDKTKQVALTERSYTADIELDYEDGEANKLELDLLSGAAAGGFTFNGASRTLNYLPLGPNTAPIIQATSTFAKDATVDVSYLNPTTNLMVTLEDVSTAKANSVSKLGADIEAAVLADAGVANMLTKLVITINAPSTNVTLFTGFKDTADKDRLGVPNQQ